MPIPEPREGEKRDDFISRCISTLKKVDPDKPDKQRKAICYTKWKEKS